MIVKAEQTASADEDRNTAIPAVPVDGLKFPAARGATIKAVLLALLIATSILAMDLSMPLGVAGGVLYTALVLTGWWFHSRSAFILLALLASVLTITGYYLSPQGGEN